MALTHAVPGQVLDLHPLGPKLAGAKTTALFKSRDLEVIRLVLLAGRALPPHKVPGEITIQCIEGSLAIELVEGSTRLQAGQMMYLAGDASHGVTAISDAMALVTIALKP